MAQGDTQVSIVNQALILLGADTISSFTDGSSVILVSPVHPVTEGHSVTLHCKHKTDSSPSNVDFYRNTVLVQNKTNGEMLIPVVSRSDEGFYMCKYSEEESPESWLAVGCEYTVLYCQQFTFVYVLHVFEQ